MLIFNIVLIQYDGGREISRITSVSVLSLVYLFDFIFASSARQKYVFYIPMFIELFLLGLAYLAYHYKAPERWAKESRFVNLYLTGCILFSLFFLNFVVEAHNILYDTLKLNSGNFNEDEDDWYRFSNIFDKS